MLELRPTCEHCNKALAPESAEAMICTFECTFCKDCVETIMHNVCPNCGGGFQQRPIRPKGHLAKYPPTSKITHKPIDMEKFAPLLEKSKEVDARDR